MTRLLLLLALAMALPARAEEPACRRDRNSGFVICRESVFDGVVRSLLDAERDRDLAFADLRLLGAQRDAAMDRAKALDAELRALPPCPAPSRTLPVLVGAGAFVAGVLLAVALTR